MRILYVFCNAVKNSADFLDKLKKKLTESVVSICSVSVKKISLKITKVMHTLGLLSLTLPTVLVLQPGLCRMAHSCNEYVRMMQLVHPFLFVRDSKS